MNSVSNILNFRRFYTNGKIRSHIIADLIGESAKIQGLGFKGVRLVPYAEALGLNAISELADIMWERPVGEFNEHEWLAAIEHTIESKWDPSKLNLILHSSGYDSRVISHFLCRSYKKKPGPILFVCIAPEVVGFEKIMRLQGWDESQMTTYDRYADPFNLMSDFGTAWEGWGSSSEIPTNVAVACIKYLQMTDKLPENLNGVVLWTGMHVNELFVSMEALAPTMSSRYDHRMASAWGLACPNIVAPVLSVRSLRAIFSKSGTKGYSNTKNQLRRKHLVEMLDPKLADIKRIKPPTGQNIHPSAANRMAKDFRASYYYKHIKQVPIPKLDHTTNPASNREFWKVWTFASLVEHLVKRGVKLS